MARKRSSKSLSKSQKKAVRKIAMKVVDEEIEDKQTIEIYENQQIFHNKPLYAGKLIGSAIQQGVQDGDQGTGTSGPSTVRIGDSIRLKNINIRFWLSNKLDRPNVMYKGVLYWYPVDRIPGDTDVYKTQSNKMLDRYNNKVIKVIDTFIVNSNNNYANTPVFSVIPGSFQGRERSQLTTLNKSYKNKKIIFDNNGPITKGWELGFAVAAYDAFGTLQTDNIASIAYAIQLTFQDA